MKRTYRYILSSKTRRSSLFVMVAATILMVAAMLGSCDKPESTQSTNASTVNLPGTQTKAAYNLETITPTNPPVTNTPTLPPPTETPTVTPTQTPNPTPTPEIPYLITQFSLNPDRQYTFVETEYGARYLRDEHNRALMLEYVVIEEAGQQIGEWVDTSLEEKYGHLVPENETLHAYREIGYMNIDGVSSRGDDNYQNLILLVRNTGNIFTETVYDPDLGREVTRLIGQAVYRNRTGGLEILNLIYNTVDVSQPIFLPRVCIYQPPGTLEDLFETPGFCPVLGTLGITPDQALDPRLMGTPGQPFRVRITHDRPARPPAPFVSDLNPNYSNINSLANWYLWQANSAVWTEIAESILRTGVNPYPEVSLGVTWADLYMSLDEIHILDPLFPTHP